MKTTTPISKASVFSLLLLLLMWASPPSLFAQAPTSTCDDPIEVTTTNCGTATNPNTPSGGWGPIPVDGIIGIRFGFPGGANIDIDLNCITDDVDLIGDLEIRLDRSAFVSGPNPCFQYLENVYDIRDTDGNEALELITILVEFTGCSSDTQAPVVTCTEFAKVFNDCPVGLGPNTPSGDWFDIPSSGIISTSAGGSYLTNVDLNSCVTDNLSPIGDMEWELVSSYSENTIPGCSIDLINEIRIRDACQNESASTFLVRSTIRDIEPPEVTCAEFTATFPGCPGPLGANTPTGAWFPVGPTGGFTAASGGIYTIPVDLTSCVSDNCVEVEDLEYSLASSYEENRTTTAVTLVNEFSVRDVCERVAINRVITKITIENEAPVVTCAEFTSTQPGCPDGLGPNTPNGMWFPIGPSGSFLAASGGSYTVLVDLNSCVSDDFTSLENLEYSLFDSYEENRTPTSVTLVNEISIRDECGDVAADRVITKITIENEAPVVTCAEFTSTQPGCPDGLGPNTPNGMWFPIGPSGSFLAASGGSYTVLVDLNSCVSDDFTSLENLEYSLFDSYEENRTPTSVTLVNEISIRDECGDVAADRVITKITIENEAPVVTCTEFTSTQTGCPDGLGPNTPNGMWFPIGPSGSFLAASGGSFIISVDLNPCVSDDFTSLENLEYSLFDSYTENRTDCQVTLVNEFSIRDECGDIATDRVITKITVQDDEAPVVTCAEITSSFNRCPSSVFPNTPNGNWVAVPASGIFRTAVGGSSITTVDLNSCVTDNCSDFGDMERTLVSSYEENRTSCSVDIINEIGIRDACENVALTTILVRSTIQDTEAPTVTCADFTTTLSGCPGPLGPNTPNGNWIVIGPDLAFASVSGGSFSIPVDLSSCVSDNCTALEDMEYMLFDSYEENRTSCQVTLVNEFSIRDACGLISPDKVVTRITIEDVEQPVVTCTDFTSTQTGCPDGLGPNTPNGVWIAVGPTGGFTAASGGSFSIPVDLTSCVTDNCTDLAEIEITLFDSYEENRTSCAVTLVNEFSVRDECGLIAADRIITRITIQDDEAPEFDLACQIDAEFFTEDGNLCPTDATISLNEGDEIDVFTNWSVGGIPVLGLQGCVADNCTDEADLTITVDDIAVVDNSTCSRTITVTFIATDECDNDSDPFVCNYTFIDNTVPVFDLACQIDEEYFTEDGSVCPADATSSLSVGDQIDVFTSWTVGGETIPGLQGCVADNCTDEADLTITVDDIAVVDNGTCERTITMTFIADDGCGNFSQPFVCNYTFFDNTVPVFDLACQIDEEYFTEDGSVCPADATSSLSVGDQIDVFTSWTVGGETIPGLQGCVADNCTDEADLTITVDDIAVVDNSTCERTITMTFIADDGCGNFSLPFVCNYTFFDNTVPVFDLTCQIDEEYFTENGSVCPADATSSLSVGDQIDVFTSWTVGGETIPGLQGCVADNCTDEADLTITVDDIAVVNNSTCERTITMTFIADDGCGNFSLPFVCNYTFIDDTPPVVACTEFSETFNRCPDGVGPNTPNGMWVSIPASGLVQTAVGGSSVATIDLNCISDNCGPVGDLEIRLTRSFEENRVPGCSVDILNEFEVRDGCGNVSPDLILYRGQLRFDGPPPVLVNPPAIRVECGTSTAPAVTGMATATSGCGTPVVTFSDQVTPFCGLTETITRTWLATDGCGKTSTATQLVITEDTTPPTFSGAPDITVNCDDNLQPGTGMGSGMGTATASSTAPLTWSDATSGLIGNVTASVSGVPAGALVTDVNISLQIDHSFVGDLNLTLVSPDGTEVNFLDGSGSFNDNVNVTFDDQGAPYTTVSASSDVGTPDDCSNDYLLAATISGVLQPEQNNFMPFNGGSSINGNWFIRVNDDASGDGGCFINFSVSVMWAIPVAGGAGTGTPMVTDVCSAGPPALVFADDVRPGACPGNYTIRRTWTATDECFNSSSYLQIITVQDIEGPVFAEAPGDLDANLTNVALDAFGSGLCLTALDLTGVEAAINAGLTAGATGITGITFPTPTDACSDPIVTTATVVVAAGAAQCFVLIDVTYTSTDACGNSSDYLQQLNVIDVAPPVLTVLAPNVTVECDMPTDVAATGSPVFVDECPGAIVTITNADVEVADPTCPNGKTITRTFTATDPCGNTAIQVQVITVVDTEAPVYTVFPRDTTVECSSLSGMMNTAVNAKSVADGQGLPTVEDNCSTGLLAPFTDVFTLSANCPTVGIYERIFAPIDDGCGNILPARTLTITVIDTMAPIFTSIPIGGDFDCTVGIPPVGTATAVDCDPNVVVTEVDDETIVGVNQVVSITERTITARDFCGNETSQVETYRVLDQVGPFLISCPSDIGPIVARPDDRAQVNFATPVFDDNCSFSVSGTHASGEDFPVGLTQVTYTAIDGGGNITICEFTIEVVKALNLTCLDHDISIDNTGDLTPADINFPYAATDCDACPQGEPLPSLDYLGYFRGHRYYTSVAGDTRSWTEAQRHAVSLGGRLVEINSAEENLFLQRESPHAQALIGHYTGPRSSTWTGTFSPEIFENWASGFPTTGTNEFFALLSAADGTHSNANHSEMPYIVEFPCVEIDVIGMTPGSPFGQGPNLVIFTAEDQCGNRDTCQYSFGVDVFDVVYCSPSGDEIAQEEDYYVTGVSIGAFAKTLDADDLFYQVRDTVELIEDVATAITLTAETSGMEGASFPAYWRVWVDANKDGDFYETGELIYEAFGDATHTGSIMLPSALSTVNPTRIRVAFSRYAYPEPCGDNPFGAVVDFTLKSNSTTLPRLALAGARGMGFQTLTTTSQEEPEVDAYLMLRGASADDLTKIDFWSAVFGDNQHHEYVVDDLDPMPSAYYQAVALDDQGVVIRSSNIVHLTMPLRRDPVRVFPNPAVHEVYIDFGHGDLTPKVPVGTAPSGDIQLYDALGRIIQTQTFELGVKRVRMNLPRLATGAYMLRITRPNMQAKNVRIMIDQDGGTVVTGA